MGSVSFSNCCEKNLFISSLEALCDKFNYLCYSVTDAIQMTVSSELQSTIETLFELSLPIQRSSATFFSAPVSSISHVSQQKLWMKTLNEDLRCLSISKHLFSIDTNCPKFTNTGFELWRRLKVNCWLRSSLVQLLNLNS